MKVIIMILSPVILYAINLIIILIGWNKLTKIVGNGKKENENENEKEKRF